MTKSDVERIFNDSIQGGEIVFNGCSISIDNFLYSPLTSFANAPDNPTKQDLLVVDGGIKGYADLIEQGIYS